MCIRDRPCLQRLHSSLTTPIHARNPSQAESITRSRYDTLHALGYINVETRVGDGYYGWPEHAPFDGIVVTAAAGHIPPPLVEQLAPSGRMVIPIGAAFATQQLMLVEKRPDGTLTTRQLLPVRFVPLTRAE